MTDIIGHINASMTIAKNLSEIIKTYDNSILIKQVSDLNFQLAKVQDDAALVINELRELKTQRQEDLKNPLTITQCGFYLDASNNRYCAGCYDGPTRHRVHLVYINTSSDCITYSCPVCKTEYMDKKEIGFIQNNPRNVNYNPLAD